MQITDGQIEITKDLLKFPVTSDDRDLREKISQEDYSIRSYMDTLLAYESTISQTRAQLRKSKLNRFKLEKQFDDLVSLDTARSILGEVAKLAWIEKVSIQDHYLHIFTRKDMLKTLFDIQIVGIGGGSTLYEFLAEPTTASMPQYEIRISLKNLGGNWATRVDVLAIRFSNHDDVDYFDGKGIFPRQRLMPHWASSGGTSFQDWNYLCLGEYERDLKQASAQGLVPFLNELSQYLQLSGDEHAYVRKPAWALLIGKKEYVEFNGRLINVGETQKSVNEKYKRDYKLMHQPEGVVEADPANVARARQETEIATTLTEEAIGGARNHIRNGGFVMAPTTWRGWMAAQGPTTPTIENCDCDLREETDVEVYEQCGCAGICECHSDGIQLATTPVTTNQPFTRQDEEELARQLLEEDAPF